MPIIKTKTTYLEMRSPPAWRIEPPSAGVEVLAASAPSTDDYLAWYRAVGETWQWTDRLQMATDELQALLDEPGVSVLLLRVDRQTAGFVEIDGRDGNDVEIKYFGLYPEFIGRGLGKYFLNAIIHEVWRSPRQRLWLHTCDCDSEAALPNYLKAGFEIFDEKVVDKVVP
jgi:GNAT superfamily N-acetyltransferase